MQQPARHCAIMNFVAAKFPSIVLPALARTLRLASRRVSRDGADRKNVFYIAFINNTIVNINIESRTHGIEEQGVGFFSIFYFSARISRLGTVASAKFDSRRTADKRNCTPNYITRALANEKRSWDSSALARARPSDQFRRSRRGSLRAKRGFRRKDCDKFRRPLEFSSRIRPACI